MRSLAHRRPLRRVARIHRRGVLGSATRRGGVHPAGAFCSSSMAHAPPLYPMRGSAPPRNLEPGTCRNMYASQHPSCCHLRRGTGTLEPWDLQNLTAPPWNLEPRNAEPEGEYGFTCNRKCCIHGAKARYTIVPHSNQVGQRRDLASLGWNVQPQKPVKALSFAIVMTLSHTTSPYLSPHSRCPARRAARPRTRPPAR